MRICFVCDEYPPGQHGGIGTMTQVLGRALVRAGHEIRVIGTYPPGYAAPNYEVDNGVRVWRLRQPAYRLGWVTARYRLFQVLARWARSGKVDLIEVPDWEGGAAGWPRLPAPVVARLHGSTTYFSAEQDKSIGRTLFWLERASLSRADFQCSVSRYTAEKTQQLFSRRTGPDAILYNSVEVPDDISTSRSRNRVVFTGTLTEKKGILSLIKAWPRVTEVHNDAELHIFGKDEQTNKGQPMRAHLLTMLDDSARDSVHFHGHVTRAELMQELQMARLAVFPSYAEAFGIAPLEAMVCGCPTIYSERCSGPELIEHGVNGLLINPDRPADIAEAIISVLADDCLAARLGSAGRDRVRENFSSGVVMKRNEDFYKYCLSNFPRKSGHA